MAKGHSLSHLTLNFGGGGGGVSCAPCLPPLATIAFTYDFHFTFLRLINHKCFLGQEKGWAGLRRRADGANTLCPGFSGTLKVSGPWTPIVLFGRY